jgi:hypothetical protein
MVKEKNGSFFYLYNKLIVLFFSRYQLSQIYKQSQRLERTKDCLFYALELENTTPILPFTTLPYFV